VPRAVGPDLRRPAARGPRGAAGAAGDGARRDRMIRVAFLQASLPVGGAERLVESLMRGFDAGRVTAAAVNLYAPGPIGEALATAGFEVRSGLAAHRFDPRAGGALARALAALESDVVYVADSAMPLFWVGWRRRRAERPRLVGGFH